MKPMPNGPPVSGSQVERDELDGDGDAEGGDGEIVGAQPERQRADQERGERRRQAPPPSQPTTIGRSKPPKRSAVVGRGQQRRGIGADRDEAGDADIEQPGLAPLHVEAEADDGVGQRHGQEEGARSRAGRRSFAPSRTGPAGA